MDCEQILDMTSLRQARVNAGISGRVLCAKTGIDPSRLSGLERGSIRPTSKEITRLGEALQQLISAKKQVIELATACGWPTVAI